MRSGVGLLRSGTIVLLLALTIMIVFAPRTIRSAPLPCTVTLLAGDSIQAAVDGAHSGDVICLSPGLYQPSATIQILEPLTIQGPQAGVDPRPSCSTRTAGNLATEAIIDRGGTLDPVVRIGSSDVTIDGVEVRNGGVLISAPNGSSAAKERPRIQYSILHHATADGIVLQHVHDATIQFNHIFEVAETGVTVCCGSSLTSILSNEVDHADSAIAGIYVYDQSSVADLQATIQLNLVHDMTKGDGIRIGVKGGIDGNDVGGTITQNKLYAILQDGISVYTKSTTVSCNEVFGSTGDDGAIYVGYSVSGTQILENSVHDNGPGRGGLLTYGIRVGSGTIRPVGTIVHTNCITGNQKGMIYVGTAPLDARFNWWGAASGPSGAGPGTGDSVATNIDFSGFLTTAACGTCVPTGTCLSCPNCDDGNACTTDTCDPGTGTCTHTFTNCDDGLSCTDDSCNVDTGECAHVPNDANQCSDGSACTTDVCRSGVCVTTPIDCDDGNLCTKDACDPTTGCTHVPDPCDDGNPCTDDSCNPTSGCVHTPTSCNDSNKCTTDACDPAIGCTHVAVDCNDHDKCTDDSCSPDVGCVHTPTSCDDGNACTTDTCDSASGCAHTTVDCNDHDKCTDDSCDPTHGCVHTPVTCNDGNPCTDDSCAPETGCIYTPDDTNTCTDGNACTNDACVRGSCRSTPIVCDDGNPCTDDSCNTETGCVYKSDDTNPCTDGNACTTDRCSDGTCTSTPRSCDDGNACTTDTCDPATGCAHNTIDCNDHDKCTNDSCNRETGCVFTPVSCDDGNACTTDTCDPASGCAHTTIDCNDHDKCTNDSCNRETGCVFTAVSCDDGNACTTDTCDPASGCAHTTIVCSDGDACTNDSCDPLLGCRYLPFTCDDKNPCTDDSCNRLTGCVYTPNDTNACSDGSECTTDACVSGRCIGTPIVCVDGNLCTDDTCDPEVGCVFVPAPGRVCDDGKPCTGEDACAPSPAARLRGPDEVPPVLTAATGELAISIDAAGTEIHYVLSYQGLDPATITAAHIHVGPVGVGGPVIFPLAAGPFPTPRLGVLHAADLTPQPAQGVNTLADAIAKILAGETYVNVHTVAHPAGEIRGQILADTGAFCAGGPPVDCDDGNACTADTCDPVLGCLHRAISCDDNDACTNDSCDPASGCVHAPVSCDDGNACTKDACDPASGCSHTTIDCNDHDKCTNDSCNRETGCVFTPVSCDDHSECTIDSCDPASGCSHTQISCDDENPCTDDSCNPASGCVYTPDDRNTCSDGNACTRDRCMSGTCVPLPIKCDDRNPCTDDKCDPFRGCIYTPDDTNPCSDGSACTTDACVAGTCRTTPIVCNDGNPCTLDRCDPATGCVYVPSPGGTPCGDPSSGPCDKPDSCDGLGSCRPNTSPDGTPCGDTTVCDGIELCEDGVCQPGTPLHCDDGCACTADTCDPLKGCVHTPIPFPCESGGVCSPVGDNGSSVPSGNLSVTVDPNGDVNVTFTEGLNINDNSYGANVVTWPRDHKFRDLVGSDKAQFVFRNSHGDVVFDFFLDYISQTTGTPSGYATLGVGGGEGHVTTGQAPWLLTWQTSEARNLNETGYCSGGHCVVGGVDLLVDSPPTIPAHTGYDLPPQFSQWVFPIQYTVKVSHLAFGSEGFGSVVIPFVHNSPPKVGDNATPFQNCPGGPCPCDQTCDDGDACTADSCAGGECSHTPVSCDDGNSCTIDSCDPARGCVHAPDTSAACSDVCVIPGTDGSAGLEGTLQATVDANGDVTVVFTEPLDLNDNSYGTNIVNWPRDHRFQDLVGSDKAQFVFKNGNGDVVFDFFLDYISQTIGAPSGYASLGANGGEGHVNAGQLGWLLDWQTSLAANLNTTGYCSGGACSVGGGNLLVDSPPTSPSHTGYDLPPQFSQWVFPIVYRAKVSHLAFGPSGFGGVSIPLVHNSPPKIGPGGVTFGPCPCDVSCDDGDPCTVDDCSSGSCTHTPATCDDQNPCTIDSCDPTSGCVHRSSDEPGCSNICTNSAAGDPVPGGTLGIQVLQNGDVEVVFTEGLDINDNSYGANVVNWPRDHKFRDLVGSDKAQFVFRNGHGDVVFDFYLDYVTEKTGTPSGYASLGVSGGEGHVNAGQAAWLLDWQTSIASNLNETGYCSGGACSVGGVNLLVDSPPTSPPNTSYDVAPQFSQWVFPIAYRVKVSHLAFGSSGFGGVAIPFVHNSPPKRGPNATPFFPCPNTDCNDHDKCTTDTFENGVCVHTPIKCDDGDPCTVDSCDPSAGCVFTPGSTEASISSDFNGTAIPAGRSIWFSSNLQVTGLGTTKTTIVLTGASLRFRQGVSSYDVPAPDGLITFDPAASCAQTVFNTALNRWETTVPMAGSDEVFLSGLAYRVPTNLAGGTRPVEWHGYLGSDTPGIHVSWKWGAAVYGTDLTPYTTLAVKPAHTGACGSPDALHAGTPQAKKTFVIGGARGGGGANYTGSWTGTGNLMPGSCLAATVSSLDAVEDLRFVDRRTLRWDPSGAPRYDALRGDLAAMKANRSVGDAWCEQDDVPESTFADDLNPSVGRGFYYVIRSDAAIPAPGTYDTPGVQPRGGEGRDPQVGTAGGVGCAHDR